MNSRLRISNPAGTGRIASGKRLLCAGETELIVKGKSHRKLKRTSGYHFKSMKCDIGRQKSLSIHINRIDLEKSTI